MGLEIRTVKADWEPPTTQRKNFFQNRKPHPYEPKDNWKQWNPHYDKDWLSAWRRFQIDRIIWYLKLPLIWIATMLGLFWMKSYGWPKWNGTSYSEEDSEPNWLNYRPRWSNKERTHLQLYETVSEGTPLSPPMPDIESLARWCSENKGIWNSTDNMTYDDWLTFGRSGGWAPSLMITPGVGVETGVEFIVRTEKDKKDVL